MVPALRNAKFARLGCMHRNTFIESPKFLDATLRLRPELPCAKDLPPTWFAGQITGSEGYTEAVATGWYSSWNMAQTLLHGKADPLPEESCIASLMNRLVEENEDFQPMNFNFGLLPHKTEMKKKNKKEILAAEAERAVQVWINSHADFRSAVQ